MRGSASARAACTPRATPTDLVSDADLAAESAIRAVLAQRRPGDAILGEEGGRDGRAAQLRWIVDPLDGTINFLFGIPAFAVSVACEDDARDARRRRARPDARGVLQRHPVRAAAPQRRADPALAREELAMAMVATGFSYDSAVRARQAEVAVRVLPRVRDIRRVGAAALDLAWCACGRFDGYYERGLGPWDWAAGALVAERAGLSVRRLSAVGEDPAGLVVASPGMVEDLYALVAA